MDKILARTMVVAICLIFVLSLSGCQSDSHPLSSNDLQVQQPSIVPILLELQDIERLRRDLLALWQNTNPSDR